MQQDHPRRIELGCGNNKRDGFFGIDMAPSPDVDLLLNIEKNPLPFEDNSVDYVYSNHTFEHLDDLPFVLGEIFRVCRPEALLEIWTPYGKSNDGMLFGHRNFITETHFKHMCFEHDRFYLGQSKGYFHWEKSHYSLYPDILNSLVEMRIPFDFALQHLFNIAVEWGVFLRVKKDAARAPGPQYPGRVLSYGRTEIIEDL